MSATPNLTFVTIPGTEIVLIPGSAPELSEILADFAGPEAVAFLQPILPYCLMVRNGGAMPFQSVTVRWNLTYDGQIVPDAFQFSVLPNGVRTGEIVLMTPGLGLTLYIAPLQTRPELVHDDMLSLAMANTLQRYASQSEITITLDSVIFPDNTIIGPDLAGKREEMNRERSINRQIATALLNKTPAERLTYIQALSHDRAAENAPATEYERQQQVIADIFRGMILATGNNETFLESSLRDVINHQTEELRRRNP